MARKESERNARIWDLWLACETEEEIAASADLSERQVRSILAEQKQEIVKLPVIPDSLQPYNLWSFTKAAKEFGEDYPGRLPDLKTPQF